jgi:hypothetical protein
VIRSGNALSETLAERPVLVVTSDVDWASEACIDDFVDAMADLGIVPTLFATHASPALAAHHAAGRVEIGIHPNFFAGSSHGASEAAVVEHITGLFPNARLVRSHGYYESSRLAPLLRARGIADDSNLCLFLERGIRPIAHWTGLRKWPVFWEDDIHWTVHGDRRWDADTFYAAFASPGLKILDIHPFNFAFNIDGDESYARLKHLTQAADRASIARRRISGPGSRSFILDMLRRLANGGTAAAPFSTLLETRP